MTAIKRSWSVENPVVTRDESDEAEKIIYEGHAAVFNQRTQIGSPEWGFVEKVAPDAFRDVLNDDVRLLVNHAGLPLARTANGTLKLSQDDIGLRNVAELADISITRDLVTLLDRRDVTQQSFAFTIASEEWVESKEDGERTVYERTITKVERLFDTSIVTFPAYTGAEGGLRAADISKEEVIKALRNITSEEQVIKDLAHVDFQRDARAKQNRSKGFLFGITKPTEA